MLSKEAISGYPPVKCVNLISTNTYENFRALWEVDVDISKENATSLFRVGLGAL